MNQWKKLPFIVTDDTTFTILETWPLEWCAPDLAELEKAIEQKKKDNGKQRVTQLAKKRQKEIAITEVRVAREVAHKFAEQKKAT